MDYPPKMASVATEHEQDDSSKLNMAGFPPMLEDDLYSFPATAMEVDVSLEWLSAFVEDCLSAKGSSSLNIPSTPSPNSLTKPTPTPHSRLSSSFATVPSKARSKRRRSSIRSRELIPMQNQHSSAHPLLLQQTYWLADSELLLPNKARKGENEKTGHKDTRVKKKRKPEENGGGSVRRCSHCEAQRTPQWRGGPLGPKTLCNACGVRYKKSGGLVPEYRPANSPTFVTLLHSNSHKRVLEMRMINASSSSSAFSSSST